MPAKPTIRKVRLCDLKTTFFVRIQLDQEHVLKLADLYAAGAQLPPLQVTSANEVVDGRHRKEAMELAFSPRYETDVLEVSEDTVPELIALALKSNEGGSKQPTRADIVHTLRLLIQERTSEKKIYDLLGSTYPKAVLRKYLEQARRTLKKAILQIAKVDVANGMTVREAAEKHGVEIVDLKKAIAPSVGVNQDRLDATLREISKRYFALSRTNLAVVKRMVVGFVDGDVHEKAVDSVLEKLEDLTGRQIRQLKDWRNRYEAAKKGNLISWKEISQTEEGAAA